MSKRYVSRMRGYCLRHFFRPFDKDKISRVGDEFYPAKLFKFAGCSKPVGINMDEAGKTAFARCVAFHNDERRRNDILTNAKFSCNGLRKRCLARAKIAGKRNDGRAECALPAFLPPRLDLVQHFVRDRGNVIFSEYFFHSAFA